MALSLVAFSFLDSATTSGTNSSTASLSWQTGDIVVLFFGTEGGTGGETIGTPSTTGSGISFGTAQQSHNSTGTDAGLACWAAVASANSSGTFSCNATHSSGSRNKVIAAYICRGSSGIGNSNISTGSGRTVALTPAGGADGMIFWVNIDWNTDTAQTITPTATTHSSGSPGPSASPQSVVSSPNYTFYIANLDDQTSAGSTSYGIGGANTGPFTIIAIEAKAAAGGATPVPAEPIVVPSLAAIQAGSW